MQPASYQQAAAEFEKKWQKTWRDNAVFSTPNPGQADFDAAKKKVFVLDMLPYPSGIGLHIGHPLGYIATDIYQRFKRMNGCNVLYSMGFDAFGLPAEQYAIQTGQHPAITTRNNIENMLDQLRGLGLGHDEQRRFSTTDPQYYKWTQWIFLQIFNSFYDPTESWIGPDGNKQTGRARPVALLRSYLEQGSWVLDAEGIPAPKSHLSGGTIARADQIEQAIDHARLAYVANIPVNWCPMLGTVLSNEEVTSEGTSERGNYPVYRRPLKQWNLQITKYAERLLNDLNSVDWPSGVVDMQREWIGKSTGATVQFSVTGHPEKITVFTTRPDTLFGATYMVLAPAHPLVEKITSQAQKQAVADYVEQTAQASGGASGRSGSDSEKTGVFTGSYAINPVTGEQIAIWISDYVLMEYGTGAIMCVPAHDERDFAFAQRFSLPVRAVLMPPKQWLEQHASSAIAQQPSQKLAQIYQEDPKQFIEAFCGDGKSINSANEDISLNGLATEEAKKIMIQWLQQQQLGEEKIQYKLRDWLFSRQRYWGEPFPVLFDDAAKAWPLAEDQLPLKLPELSHFAPEGSEDPHSSPKPPLARAEGWEQCFATIDDSGFARIVSRDTPGARRMYRDPNTMPNWAGSCWYYLRYFDPQSTQHFVSPQAEEYWSGKGTKNRGAVDLYVGGTEHAVLHLLYARFWHKVLYDLGHVSTCEPFERLFNQGMITADAYKDERGLYVDIHDVEVKVEENTEQAYQKSTGKKLTIDPGKMGKRYKNGIPPEEVASQYSVDTFRCYEMYMGPLEASKPWKAESIIGIQRFLSAVWNFQYKLCSDAQAPEQVMRELHQCIKKVTEDIEKLRLNTALAALMELKNSLSKLKTIPRDTYQTMLLLLAPFAPHMVDELFKNHFSDMLAEKQSVIALDWPQFDEKLCQQQTIGVAVMVNGKKRDVLTVAPSIARQELESQALSSEKVLRFLDGKKPRKVIVVQKPNSSIVNIVV